MSILPRRNRAPTSKMDDILVLNANVAPVLNAPVNNWDPVELQDFSVIGIAASVAGVTLSGIEDGFPGRVLVLGNVGANPIDLLNENVGSLTRNRLILGAASLTLIPDGVLIPFIYLGSRWRRMI